VIVVDYEKLLDKMGNDKDSATMILESLERGLDKWEQQAIIAVTNKDTEAIGKIVHLIKGTAGTVMALELEQSAISLGELAKNGHLDDIDEALKHLKSAFTRLKETLQKV
jgi:HPt (histidine-containing phosphotransfer) domain-containing protein